MKQIDLRLALVLYGGVSLSIYMHGVTREFLNLLRASKSVREKREGTAETNPEHDNDNGAPAPDVLAYENIFKALAPNLELRVITDVISGASAGGINGVMLARAIAHNLSLDSHSSLWLRHADVTELSDPPTVTGRLLKRTIAPVIDRVVSSMFKLAERDEETRTKLRHLVQTRWFQPPFSGERFTNWMLDASLAMDDGSNENRGSLLPPGNRLDLFVTLTDYQGHLRRISLDDPPFIDEHEHRRILKFSCEHQLSGELVSEFTGAHIPSLVFAARATSSFPGAFPPASVGEMDDVLEKRRGLWPDRERFLRDQLDMGWNEGKTRYFIDGSVVMNKPFSPVIAALGNRPANREVVRRIIYVDPVPQDVGMQETMSEPPGFFRTILASLAQIPRNEPIGDDLRDVEGQNERIKRISDVIASVDPVVEKEVEKILPRKGSEALTVRDISHAREEANAAAHAEAGYATVSYRKLKLQSVVENVAQLISDLAAEAGYKADAGVLVSSLEEWLKGQKKNDAGETTFSPIVEFLRGVDVNFRIRRLRFVIRRLNQFYKREESEGVERWGGAINDLKMTLYEFIDELDGRWKAEYYGQDVQLAALDAAKACHSDAGKAEGDALKKLMELLVGAMTLGDMDRYHDDVFAVMTLNYLAADLRHELNTAYIGFAFYDLVTLPILQWHDLAETNEILVDRISPADAENFRDGPTILKGMELHSFGAFFNRSWREHDYLWGRLNGADRIVSIILLTIGEKHAKDIDERVIRRDLFMAILDDEEGKLTADSRLISSIRRDVHYFYSPRTETA